MTATLLRWLIQYVGRGTSQTPRSTIQSIFWYTVFIDHFQNYFISRLIWMKRKKYWPWLVGFLCLVMLVLIWMEYWRWSIVSIENRTKFIAPLWFKSRLSHWAIFYGNVSSETLIKMFTELLKDSYHVRLVLICIF